MNIRSITKAFGAGITKMLDATHGVLFSAADLSEAIKTHKHARAGEYYQAEIGIYGTFDVKSEAGQAYIEKTRSKLYLAQAAYDRTFKDDAHMLDSDRVIEDELGASI